MRNFWSACVLVRMSCLSFQWETRFIKKRNTKVRIVLVCRDSKRRKHLCWRQTVQSWLCRSIEFLNGHFHVYRREEGEREKERERESLNDQKLLGARSGDGKYCRQAKIKGTEDVCAYVCDCLRRVFWAQRATAVDKNSTWTNRFWCSKRSRRMKTGESISRNCLAKSFYRRFDQQLVLQDWLHCFNWYLYIQSSYSDTFYD